MSVVGFCSASNCCDTEQRSASQPGSVVIGTLCITFGNVDLLPKFCFQFEKQRRKMPNMCVSSGDLESECTDMVRI